MRGDQIYVMRPLAGMDSLYEHHGIDCGDGTVIHYYKPGEAVISRTSHETFAQGKPVFTKKYAVSYVPDVVIQRAESRLGERQYNLLNNNCEHFATWCKIGKSESPQLANYGADAARLNPFDTSKMINDAVDSDPLQAMQQFQQSLSNLAIAQTQLQTQYNQLQSEMDTWTRVAQLALKQGKEPAARAALERKVNLKRQATELQQKINELTEVQNSLNVTRSRLQSQLTIL
ncbi:MAG: lecithin retinol acyltransferase family protein [Oculatellaceae cyanobacterium Prado106]|jgi:hypothetical protein|nr:lecithin retinol acyltransferase family protein [Oculatellaceae cyanobacterium Prado106]